MDLEVLKSKEGLIKASQIVLALFGCILSFFPKQGHSFWTFVLVTTIIISGILLGLQVGTIQDFFVQKCHELSLMHLVEIAFFHNINTMMSSLDLPTLTEPTKIGPIFKH